MAYTINKTDGTVVATITDGTVDNTTSLTLFGKSYSGFGELLNENLKSKYMMGQISNQQAEQSHNHQRRLHRQQVTYG